MEAVSAVLALISFALRAPEAARLAAEVIISRQFFLGVSAEKLSLDQR